MKVSIPWLKELVDLKITADELIHLLPLRSVSIKEITPDSIELDMKGYNRADLLYMRGVAQEVAAITDSKVKFSDDEVKSDYGVPEAKVKVENLNLCPVYCLAKIENLKVEQSNEIWVKKLSDCGIRTINNVADVTNLVMMEYGQPMHAFDARAVKDEAIIVRTAKKGERITTLDGKTRDLEVEDLLIADLLNPLGIAGVMGGKDSEITDSTTTILLEAAIFDPVNIRKTATRLGLPSEASKRFQHGLTKKRLLQALEAAIKMYESLGGKLTALSIVGDLTDPVKKVKLTQKKLDSLVGIEFKPEQVEEYLKKLRFSLTSKGDALRGWEVTAPYFRLDIEIEEDLIEEVARMYGYEKIPSQKLLGVQPLYKEDPVFKTIYDLKMALKDAGLTEVQTYSFYSTTVLNTLYQLDTWNVSTKLVKIANPISSETEYLRQSIWPNLVEVVGRNMRKGYKDIGIFEIGKAFNVGSDGKPTEDYRLAIALCNGTDNPAQELVSIFKELGMDVELKQTQPPEVVKDLFHPKRFIAILSQGVKLAHPGGVLTGELAEVHLRVLNKLGIEKRVAVLELEIELEPLL